MHILTVFCYTCLGVQYCFFHKLCIKSQIWVRFFFHQRSFLFTQENIVQQLQHRYEADTIYTYIGDILVAVNPFTRLGLYTPAVSILNQQI